MSPTDPADVPPLDEILARDNRRREARARREQLSQGEAARLRRVQDRLRAFLLALPQAADFDRDPVIPPEQRPARADELVGLWADLGEEGIGAEVISRVQGAVNRLGASETAPWAAWAAKLVKLGHDSRRQDVIEMLGELNRLPGRHDPRTPSEASQERVWQALKEQLVCALDWFHFPVPAHVHEEAAQLDQILHPGKPALAAENESPLPACPTSDLARFHMLADELLGFRDMLRQPRMDGFMGDPYLTEEDFRKFFHTVHARLPHVRWEEWEASLERERYGRLVADLSAALASPDADAPPSIPAQTSAPEEAPADHQSGPAAGASAPAAGANDPNTIIARARAVQQRQDEEKHRQEVEVDIRLRCEGAVTEYGKGVSAEWR